MAPIAWLRVDMNFLWLYLVLLSFTSFHRAVALRLPSASSRELYRVFFLPSLRKKRSSTVNGFLRGWLRLSRNTRRRNKEERATRAAVDDAWHSASASLSPPLFLNRVLLFSCFVLQASSEPDFTSFIKVSLDFTRWSLQLTLNELLPSFIHQGNFFGRISHSGFQNPNLTNQWGSKIELPSFFSYPLESYRVSMSCQTGPYRAADRRRRAFECMGRALLLRLLFLLFLCWISLRFPLAAAVIDSRPRGAVSISFETRDVRKTQKKAREKR